MEEETGARSATARTPRKVEKVVNDNWHELGKVSDDYWLYGTKNIRVLSDMENLLDSPVQQI